jgi:hypothetical protein
VADNSGEHPCYVAKGKCGHYYWAAVDLENARKEIAKEMADIIRRGDIVERKTVQFVRDGGLDWTKACREGLCNQTEAARRTVAEESTHPFQQTQKGGEL